MSSIRFDKHDAGGPFWLRGGVALVIVTLLSTVAISLHAGVAYAEKTPFGLLLQNQTTSPVFIAEGSPAVCINNQGSVPNLNSAATLQQNQTNQANPITIEFQASCSDPQFPFVVYVDGQQSPQNVYIGNGNPNTCTHGDTNVNEAAVGVAGMSCYMGSDKVSQFNTPNPLVYYGDTYDILYNAIQPKSKDNGNSGFSELCDNDNWDGCVGVQVIPAGQTFALSAYDPQIPTRVINASASATVTTAPPTSGTPIPTRTEIFGAAPKLQHLKTSVHNGRLTIRADVVPGTAAAALRRRVSGKDLSTRAALTIAGSGATEGTISEKAFKLPASALTKARSRNGRIELSKQATTAICSAGAEKTTVFAQQWVMEPGHTYATSTAVPLDTTKCPAGG